MSLVCSAARGNNGVGRVIDDVGDIKLNNFFSSLLTCILLLFIQFNSN